MKHPTSVTVWIVLPLKGTGNLYIVEGCMNQRQYLSVEKRCLLDTRGQVNGGYVFMHDATPCHKAKSVGKVFG